MYARGDNFTVVSAFRHGYQQYKNSEWNGSHRLDYHVYFIAIDVRLMNAIESAYRAFLSIKATSGANWRATKVL